MSAYAYYKKQFMPLSEAQMPLMTNSFHYGTAVFEGIRANWNSDEKKFYLFRLKEHYERFRNGCHLLKIDLPYSVEEYCDITVELMALCDFEEDCYIRPVGYKSQEAVGVRLHNLENDFFAFVTPFGAYLDMESAHCGVSSWRRPRGNTMPVQTKSTGLYLSGALAKTEAMENGFDEAIMLTEDGYVSEGSGENLFLVIDGKLVTPVSSSNCLIGITRNSVMELAEKELGIETVERTIDRAELYSASECFLTGTAAHLTPVSRIDHRDIGTGKVGEITKKLQELYFSVIRGTDSKYSHWRTLVPSK